jgi:hypothetical protein
MCQLAIDNNYPGLGLPNSACVSVPVIGINTECSKKSLFSYHCLANSLTVLSVLRYHTDSTVSAALPH